MKCPNPKYGLMKTLRVLMQKMKFQKTQEIKKCLKPHQFKPEKETTTSVADTDESEEQRLEKSDEECLNHCVIKQLLGKTT